MRPLPSKRIHEVLIDGLNLWLQVPDLSLERIHDIAVMLHTSSLMYRVFLTWSYLENLIKDFRLDDIVDGSKLRRDMPSAHMVYGESQTINSATYVQTRAFAEAAKLSNPITIPIFYGQLRRDLNSIFFRYQCLLKRNGKSVHRTVARLTMEIPCPLPK